MMQNYHIGTLDEASRALLKNAGETGSEAAAPRPVFLQSKGWTKAPLSGKKVISHDARIFSFTLEHREQQIGLPVGQHLMMRIRDPVANAPIIRSYTPISKGTDKGQLDVLVKVYFDTPERKGGAMTKALDAISIGHIVDFKGPIGKFEYLGKGNCTINGKGRHVKKFIMICGGSGVTPIFQVLRAVLEDDADPTKCLVLDGNRTEEDILCRAEMESLIKGRTEKCKLIHTLTRPTEGWRGLKGRVEKELLERVVGRCGEGEMASRDEMVLICGPETLEESVHKILNDLGWKDEDLLFF
jgi:nitrate reductase (NAD(P)H)